MPRITDDDLRKFGDANYERYHDFYYAQPTRDPSVAEMRAAGIVLVDGSENDALMDVCNPYLSTCGRFTVDPVETYGQATFDAWVVMATAEIHKRHRAAVIEKMKGRSR